MGGNATKNYVDRHSSGGGGGGGTTNYNELENKPSINGVTLSGNKTSADLHIESGGGGSQTYQYNTPVSIGTVDGKTLYRMFILNTTPNTSGGNTEVSGNVTNSLFTINCRVCAINYGFFTPSFLETKTYTTPYANTTCTVTMSTGGLNYSILVTGKELGGCWCYIDFIKEN